MKSIDRVIAVGASMGGLEAFKELVGSLDMNLPISVLLVQHSTENVKSHLPLILSKITTCPVQIAKHRVELLPGHIYVAPNNRHLLVEDNKIILGYGTRENGSRPSINNLFRSVASAYREKAIGIVLTGLLYDGGQGLKTIKEMGGTTIVQDPNEALFKDMPLNAIKNCEIDYISRVKDMASLVRVELNRPIKTSRQAVPKEIEKQIGLAKKQIGGDLKTHVLNQYISSDYTVTDSLYSILQMMQERTNMLENLSQSELLKGRTKMARAHFDKASECRLHTENLRKHLQQLIDKAS